MELLRADMLMPVDARCWPDKPALVKAPGRQPDANAVMHEHLHAVGPAVGKQVSMVRVRRAKYLHHPPQCSVCSGAHIQWLHGQPGAIDSDHLRMALAHCANSLAAQTGQLAVIITAPLRTST